MDLSRGVVATGENGSGLTVRGSICCFVQSRADPARRFALGCQHVFARGKANACRSIMDTWLTLNGGGTAFAKLVSAGDVRPNSPTFSLDAAISEVQDESVANRFGSKYILRCLMPDEEPTPGRYALFSPRANGTGVRADFVGVKYRQTLSYTCGPVNFATLYLFRATTQEGDSGSAVVAPDGTLIGMHIFGAVDSASGQRYSYALPAYALFDDDLFSLEIDLV